MIQSKSKVYIAGIVALIAVLALTFAASGSRNTFDARAAYLSDVGGSEFIPAASHVFTQTDAAPDSADALKVTNCRYGVGHVPSFPDSLAWLSTLNAGWHINFVATSPGTGDEVSSFSPVLRVKQDVAPNGTRLPSYTFNPPLVYQFQNSGGFTQDGLGGLILKNPGHYWIVGNEPDVDNPIQDNMMPEVYARAYHEAYHYIKSVDSTAKVAIAGLSMMTPGRLQYLDIVWDTYRSLYGVNMPVDIWNMHLYILEERNPDNPNQHGDGKIALGTDPALAKLTSYGAAQHCPALGAADIPANDPRADIYCRSEHDSIRIFREQVYAMRQWMKDHGQQNKPLIISEFGLLYPYLGGQPGGKCEFLQDEHQQCFYPERVTKYMTDTVALLETAKDPNLGYPADENRLVQQWLWFSIITRPEDSGGSSNLIVNNYKNYAPGDPAAMTMMGSTYANLAANSPGSSNLAAGMAFDAIAYVPDSSETASVTLTANFRNTGTRSIISPIQVTFYADQALTQVIGTTTYDPATSGAVFGCSWDGRNSEQISIQWDDLPVGRHPYWVKIDSGNSVTEQNESDNVTSGMAIVTSNVLFVPHIGR